MRLLDDRLDGADQPGGHGEVVRRAERLVELVEEPTRPGRSGLIREASNALFALASAPLFSAALPKWIGRSPARIRPVLGPPRPCWPPVSASTPWRSTPAWRDGTTWLGLAAVEAACRQRVSACDMAAGVTCPPWCTYIDVDARDRRRLGGDVPTFLERGPASSTCADALFGGDGGLRGRGRIRRGQPPGAEGCDRRTGTPRLRPFAAPRQGSVLDDALVVGNDVEVKGSTPGRGRRLSTSRSR